MKTLDQLLLSAIQSSAKSQSSRRDGTELRFPLCWQAKAVLWFISIGCGFLLVAMLSATSASGDPWYFKAMPTIVLLLLPLMILLLAPAPITIDSSGVRQRFWWGRRKYLSWSEFASVIHDRDSGSTIVYGKFSAPITFSAYLVDQTRFDREVKAYSRQQDIPDNI